MTEPNLRLETSPEIALEMQREPGFSGRPDYRVVHFGQPKAEDYDRDFHDPNTAKGVHWAIEQRLLARMLDDVVGRRPEIAVDFACGTGRVLGIVQERATRTVGIDISPDMLEIARERHPDAELVEVDVTRDAAPLDEHSVDVITAFRFFLNAQPTLRADALAWMRATLRPDGCLIANFHLNPDSLRGRYLRMRWLGRRKSPMLSPGEVRRMLDDAGFELVSISGYDLLPFRRDGATWKLPRLRSWIESRLAGRPVLTNVAGSFLVAARPRPVETSAA